MSTSSIHHSHTLRNSRLALLGLPLALLAAFFIGNAVMSSVGVPEGELLPLQWIVTMLLIVVVLLAIPVALVWRFNRRTADEGHRGAMWPFWIALAFALLAVLMNTVPLWV